MAWRSPKRRKDEGKKKKKKKETQKKRDERLLDIFVRYIERLGLFMCIWQ